jgi:hypothetical protein
MKLLQLSSLSSKGKAWIETAGTDLFEILEDKPVTWRNGRRSLLLRPFSDCEEDATHCTRTSFWVMHRMDRDVTWKEVEV